MRILASRSQTQRRLPDHWQGKPVRLFLPPSRRENLHPTLRHVNASCHRFILANTEVLHDKIGVLSSRVRQLEDALAEAYALYNTERHPLLSDELLQIKRPLERESRNEMPSPPEAESAEAIDAVGSL
jgi:hypothetical protein